MKPDDIFSRLYPSANEHTDDSRSQNSAETVYKNPTPFPDKTPLAMSYIYFQQWGQTNSPETALESGTLFPDLDKPFERSAK